MHYFLVHPWFTWQMYEGRLISNAHSEIFCQRSKVAMRAQCVLLATTLLHSGAKFHSFLYTQFKTVRVNMESCYGVCQRDCSNVRWLKREINFFLILLLGMSHGFIILTLKKKEWACNTGTLHLLARRKIKTMPSAGKILLTVFWDSQRVYMTEFLEAGNTVNSARYIETIKKPTAEGVSS